MNNLEEKDGDNYNKSKQLFPYLGEAVKSKLTFRLFFFFFLAFPRSMWESQFIEHARNHAPAEEAWSPNHWTAGNYLMLGFFKFNFTVSTAKI